MTHHHLKERFILSNTLSSFLHEAAHMLIDEYKVPVLGKEEDAADNFQTWYMIINDNHKLYYGNKFNEYLNFFHPMLEDTADYYFYENKLGYDKNENPYDTHSNNLARFHQTISIMSGGNYKSFANYFKKRKINLNLLNQVHSLYDEVDNAWHLIWKNIDNKKINSNNFILEFEETKKFHYYKNLIKNSNIMNHNLITKNFYFPLKNNIKVTFKDNAEYGACYNSDKKEIIITYEYMSVFDNYFTMSI